MSEPLGLEAGTMFGPKHTLRSVARSLYEGLESGSVVLPAPRFESRPLYSPDGDFLTLFLQDEEYYAERVDELLTVYHSIATDELIGCEIKGVQRLLETLGEFGMSVEDADVELKFLFLAGAIHSPNMRTRYGSLGRRTPRMKIPRRELQPA
jgi:hypothetical protein